MVVEDDRAVRNLILTTLETHDYKPLPVQNGKSAILTAASHNPDVILLDLGLPDIDGIEIIEKIRSWSQTPIIVISARTEDSDKISALDAGADDYLTKPFSVDELLARLRGTFRRLNYSGSVQEETVFHNDGLSIDYAAGTAVMNGTELHLTPIEYRLLCLLARNCGKILTHSFITEKIWGSATENDVASLRVYMASLRKKIEPDPSRPQFIQTHIGIGYRLIRK